jgi:hypothetical protein
VSFWGHRFRFGLLVLVLMMAVLFDSEALLAAGTLVAAAFGSAPIIPLSFDVLAVINLVSSVDGRARASEAPRFCSAGGLLDTSVGMLEAMKLGSLFRE